MPQAGSHVHLWAGQSQWEWETSSQLPSTPPTPFSLWDLLSHPTLSPLAVPPATSRSITSPVPVSHPSLPAQWGALGLSRALLLFQEPGKTQ